MKFRFSVALLCSVVFVVIGASRLIGTAPLSAQTKSALPETDIRAILDDQVTAWNRGDIEGFMAGYWKSDETTFLGSGNVTRGWQGLLERYKKGYPDKKSMGTLAFSDLEINLLGKDSAFIIGHWQLEREKDGKPDRPGGVFTLIAKKFPEGWRIVSDHTSTVAAQK